jgi:superfamily II DNA or RNA helicase
LEVVFIQINQILDFSLVDVCRVRSLLEVVTIDLSLFDALKRPTFAHQPARHFDKLLYMLKESTEGWWLYAVDSKGSHVTPDYRAYSGHTREHAKAYQFASQHSANSFQWSATQDIALDGVEIANHPELFNDLLKSEPVVNEALQPLHPAPQTHQLFLKLKYIDADRTQVQASYQLHPATGQRIPLKAPQLLSDRCILDGQTLYRIQPIGPAFRACVLFNETVPVEQLDTFLSLFASSFPDIKLEGEDYSFETGSPIIAQPAILFRDVDEHASLYLTLADALPNLSIEFVRDYDLSRIAHIDPKSRIIRFSEVQYEASHQARAALVKKMQGLDRREKSPDAYFTEDDEDGYVMGADLAKAFLSEYLAEFAAQFTLLGAEKLRRYKITHATPKLDLKLGSGIDYFEGEGTLEVANERFSLLDALQQYQKHNYLTLSDGTHAVLSADYMQRLSRIFKKRKEGLKVSFFDLPLIEELIEANSNDATFKKSRKIFEGFNQLKTRRVPTPKFTGKLRPYQKAGLQWLDYLYSLKFGGCLADDMGLGKTVQAIALLSRIYPKVKSPSMIVMPRSLLFNWARELETFAPHLSFQVYHSTDRDWEVALKHNIILTTYGTLRSDIEKIAHTQFHALILDESQAIKNLRTQTAQAALALKAKFRLALSGTPIENNLGELYTLFRFLNPNMFPSAADFDRDYATPIQKQNDDSAAQELRKKIYPFILRRLKADVLKELPPKVEQVLYVEMGSAQKKHYEERRKFYKAIIDGEVSKNGIAKSQFVILEAMLELRQIATVPESKTEGQIESAKTERLLEALEEASNNGRKCLVFSNFLAGVEQIGAALDLKNIPNLRMTGATTDRESLVERFQTDPQVKVFVMSLKTGGVGLNLTAADTVFILDPWWNTSAESQAVDRAHRIGQSNTVFTYRLIAKDSIEEKIRLLQEKKQHLVDQVVSSDSSALKSLSEDDIEQLFSA